MDDWAVLCRVDESCYAGSLLEGDWPEVFLPLKCLGCSFVTCSSDVEGGGLLADGQT
jgi:hypothetical protein